VRAKYRVDKANNLIEVYEIPYTTTTEAIIEEITKIVKDGRIRDITDVRRERNQEGLTLTIDYKRSPTRKRCDAEFDPMTSLQDGIPLQFQPLIDAVPCAGVEGIVDNWIQFRMGCIRRQCRYDIDKKNERLHLLHGLAKILLDIDKAIRIIRETGTEAEVLPNLMKAFAIDKLQAEYVADIRLRNLNREYILRQTADIAALEGEIADLQDILNHDTRVLDIICAQLAEIRKNWGKPRRSELLHEAHVEVLTDDHLIEDFNLKLFLTSHGYLKKVALTSLRSAGDHKLKEEDEIVQEVETHNKAELLLFSDRQVVYKLRIHEIPDAKASSLGEYLQNLLELEADERILYMVATDNYQGSMLFAFENGKMARVDLAAYATKTNRKKLANAYSGESRLVRMLYLPEDRDLAALSSIDKLLVFNTSGINTKTTRAAQGVQVLKSKKGRTLVSLRTLEEVTLSSPDYYRASVPAIGCYLKEEDKEDAQVALF
jgi:DNA gyrase subunit A